MYYYDGIYKRIEILGVIKYVWNLLLKTLVGFLIVLLALIFLFGFKPYVVISGSMTPSLNVGDIIFVKKVKNNNYKFGDIVTYKGGDGKFITHRVKEVVDDKLITRGDANSTDDPIISKSIVVGKTEFRLYKVGILYDFIRTNLITCTLFILICWASILSMSAEIEYYNHPAPQD